MKEILESWRNFKNNILKEERIKIYSVTMDIQVKKPAGAAAVIDDTLALIRGIPDVTVVNSKTDDLRTTRKRAYIRIEFKWNLRTTSWKYDVDKLREQILDLSPLILTVVVSKQFPVRRVQ